MRSLLSRLRNRVIHAPTRVRQAFWKRALDRHRAAYLSQTVAFDGVPTMRGLALLLGHARLRGWRGTLNSSDRRAGVAERYGKKSQARLYRGWVDHLPGYLPANPPGFSSHELRGDGNPVYERPRGARLPWYMLGLDVTEDIQLARLLESLGVDVVHPYRSAAEAHHLNVIKDPTPVLVHLKEC
jgi:hypothetical protein